MKTEYLIKKIGEEVIDLILEKNAAYGDTATNPTNVFSNLNSIEAIKNAVHSGLGAAFVSISAISKELELNMLHWAKIEGVTIKRTLSVLLNPKRDYSNATQIFKKEILEMLIKPSMTIKAFYEGGDKIDRNRSKDLTNLL